MGKIYFLSIFLGLNIGALGFAISSGNSLVGNFFNRLDEGLRRNYGIDQSTLFFVDSIVLGLILTVAFWLFTFAAWKFLDKLKKQPFSSIVKIDLFFLLGVIFSPAYLVLLVFLLGFLGFIWIR